MTRSIHPLVGNQREFVSLLHCDSLPSRGGTVNEMSNANGLPDDYLALSSNPDDSFATGLQDYDDTADGSQL